MKSKIHRRRGDMTRNSSLQDILILADGRILAHNLTPALAAILGKLNPGDEPMRQRAGQSPDESPHELPART
jgi:hypothetical protein